MWKENNCKSLNLNLNNAHILHCPVNLETLTFEKAYVGPFKIKITKNHQWIPTQDFLDIWRLEVAEEKWVQGSLVPALM